MKYGESFFDIAYLIIAIGIGICLLAKASGKLQRLMGAAALILGCGDAFHLVPRVLNYFINKDFTSALGFGKLITSVTMTVFYILMYYIFLQNYEGKESKAVTAAVWGLSLIRIALCLLPHNEWLSNNSPLLWGILRNIPFAILGLIIVILYFRNRKGDSCFRFIWLYVALSFLFYIPVVVGADTVPLLGALMLPKTICYVLILLTFLKKKKAAA
ncbi:MAG: hypothetical protein E7517_01510 [Ruminococcaceae bacterium]|nr:hypothetical protein [Oscillospiraceae bacterium]